MGVIVMFPMKAWTDLIEENHRLQSELAKSQAVIKRLRAIIDCSKLTQQKGTDMKRKLTFRLYQDKKGQWRWTLLGGNGRILADSSEGYTRQANALRTIRLIQDNMSASECVVADE